MIALAILIAVYAVACIASWMLGYMYGRLEQEARNRQPKGTADDVVTEMRRLIGE